MFYDWNTPERDGATLPADWELVDETLRDGLQSPSALNPSLETKFAMVDCMAELAIRVVDVQLRIVHKLVIKSRP